jgi:uncharacterized Zn finger protein
MREMEKLRKKGHDISPVVIEGRAIARTFWGKAWCDNLESYSDYSNRLPRGRTYIRNGSVVNLQISPGIIKAHVSGSHLYTVELNVAPVPKTRWEAICGDCAGAIDSLVELLQGRFSKGVMERLCRQKEGLFPSPREIKLSCSCPDWASMCKHVAAVLYGVGARLDHQPELLFRLRKVREEDLLAHAGKAIPLTKAAAASARVLAADDLAEMFGVEMAEAAPATSAGKPAKAKAPPTAKAAPKAADAPATLAGPKPPKPKTAAKQKAGLKRQSPATPAPKSKHAARKPRKTMRERWSRNSS